MLTKTVTIRTTSLPNLDFGVKGEDSLLVQFEKSSLDSGP